MTQWLNKFGMTPGRAALMAVLAIVLGVVWGPQLMPAGEADAELDLAVAPTMQRRLSSAPRLQSPAAAGVQPSASSPPKAERVLPDITAAQAGAYDPFAVPRWSPASARLASSEAGPLSTTDVATRFQALKDRGVAMILVSGEGKAAQVGDQTLHVGDEIDGFEVVEITDEGVVFQPVTAPQEEDPRGA